MPPLCGGGSSKMVKQSVKKKWTRIMCVALAALMVVGVAAVLLYSGGSDDHDHDHDHDEVAAAAVL